MRRPSCSDNQRLLIALLSALVALTTVAFTPQIFNDGDTYWHIAAGNGCCPITPFYSDPFSYTFAGAPWHTHEWLSEIFMALAWRAGRLGRGCTSCSAWRRLRD